MELLQGGASECVRRCAGWLLTVSVANGGAAVQVALIVRFVAIPVSHILVLQASCEVGALIIVYRGSSV